MRALWLMFLTVAVLPTASASTLSTMPGTTLRLEGTSTLHPFSFNSTDIEVSGDLVGRRPTRLLVDIPIAQLHSGESGMDKNMRKALKADQAPEIRFELTGFDFDSTRTDSIVKASVSGRLSIAGVTKAISLDADCRYGSDSIRATAQKELLMTDFGVKPPTMMMGTIRTGDKVTVRFDLRLMEKSDTASAEKGGNQ